MGRKYRARIPAPGDYTNSRDPERRLRIGYVSADLLTHAVSQFLLPILQHHDHAGFEIFAYSNNALEDAVTQQLRAACDHWRVIAGMGDQQAAQCIANDQIDILVDLSGHTGDNRLPLLASQPAPVQFTYLGYPATTGLTCIAYRLTDALADPPGMTESLHRETLLRLPRTAWCFAQPHNSPPPAPAPPISQAGHITFGSFNALAKLNERWAGTVSEILHRTPRSNLALKSRHFAHPDVVARVRDLFATHQIQPEAPPPPAAPPFPRAAPGGLCTDRHRLGSLPVSRHYDDLRSTVDGRARRHARRRGPRLARRRQPPDPRRRARADRLLATGIRSNRVIAGVGSFCACAISACRCAGPCASPLMNAPALAADIESAYRAAWQSWCDR